tara:strand:+ start:770 stop:1750 length:981 start_codon:yes stop_codon:yes gene_type:complete
MERLVARSQTALDKVTAKAVKNGNAPTNDIVELQGANKVLFNEKKTLESEVAAIEAQYSNVAKAKLDRRLKSGADEKKLSDNQRKLDAASNKKESIEKKYEDKIELLEDQKTRLDTEVEDKVNDYRMMLESKAKRTKVELDTKISELKTKQAADLVQAESAKNYYGALVEACYEVQPRVEVVYPPSYYKKKEQLEKLTRQISTNEMLVNAMALDMVTRARQPESQDEIIRRRLREQANREDAEAQLILEEQQKQEEIRKNLAKRAEIEREAEEIRERKKANPRSKPVVIDIPIEDLKAFYAKHDAVYHSDESEEENATESSNSLQD